MGAVIWEPRDSWRPTRAELLAVAALLVAVVFVVQPLKAQQASRMALTAAIAEHRTVAIDRYVGTLGVDFATTGGHTYSDKAPAQPVAAVPAYLLYRAVGGESAASLRVDGNLGLWWVSSWSAALPAAALLVVMSRLARPWSARWSLPAAMAMSFGTLLLPFASVLFSHTASALLVAGALLAWRAHPAPRAALLGTGALVGLAVAVEYTAVVALLLVGVASLLRDRARVGWVALGASAPLAATVGYHWVAFGSPFTVPYRYHNLGLHNSAVAGLRAPTPELLWQLATSERGLFALTPVVLVAAVGLVVAARAHRPDRGQLALVAALFLAFVVVQAGAADLTGGDSLGPRYVIPALPCLVVGLAVMFDRAPALCTATAVAGSAVMLLATYTEPLVSVHATGVLRIWWDLLADGRHVPLLLERAVGRVAWPVVLLGSAALAVAAVRVHGRDLAPSADVS